MATILVIEDDQALAEQIKEVLISYSYNVIVVEDFKQVEKLFLRVQPDLVLLDINLPYYDGNYYCRILRKHSSVPIIVTSARNSDLDQILSMELGADGYVVKPFSIELLMAKVNALLRRTYGDYASKAINQELKVKGIKLELTSFTIYYENKMEELSKNEFRLMKYFLKHPDMVVKREELLEELWDTDTFIDDNTLTVNITRLKSRLSGLGITDCIKTKRGVGYIFDTKGVAE